MLTRRKLIFASTVAYAVPVATWAQQGPKVIGILSPYSPQDAEPSLGVFLNALRELGYVQGKDYALVERLAGGQNDRLPGLAAELVRLKVDVICTSTTNAAAAARQATSTIPIVFQGVSDPVLAGFADSVAHPGHNLTGLANFSGDLYPKRLQLLRDMLPNLTRLAVLVNPGNPYIATTMERMRPAAERLGVRAVSVDARSSDDLDQAFGKIAELRSEGVLVTADGYFWQYKQRIAELALRGRLPTIFPFPGYAEVGGLMSYGIDPLAQIKRSAAFVDKIFKGARPGDIPIEQPTRLELAINRKTADALRLVIPPNLLLQADQVVG